MAYGERTGARKAPGEYGVVDMFGLGVAAAFGIAAATFFDLTQSDEGSALLVFNNWVSDASTTLGLGQIPLYAVCLLLMAIGGLSIIVLQPVTMRGAFAQGFGVLAAIMTIAPSDVGLPAPGASTTGPSTETPDEEGDPWGDATMLEEISYAVPAAGTAFSYSTLSARTAVQRTQGYSVRIKITFPDGFPKGTSQMIQEGSLRGQLKNEDTRAKYNLFRNTGAGMSVRSNAIYLSTMIPGSGATAKLVARIEAEGYRIEESRVEVKQGVNPVWNIRMTPGGGPLLVQRLRLPSF